MEYAAMRASLLSQVSNLRIALNVRCKSSFLLFLSVLEGTDGKTISINILSKLVHSKALSWPRTDSDQELLDLT